MSLDDELIVKPLTKKWHGTWPANCQMHTYWSEKEFNLSDDLYFVDGRTKYGFWALMCPDCHNDFGVGLGLGKGQRYDSKTLEKLEG